MTLDADGIGRLTEELYDKGYRSCDIPVIRLAYRRKGDRYKGGHVDLSDADIKEICAGLRRLEADEDYAPGMEMKKMTDGEWRYRYMGHTLIADIYPDGKNADVYVGMYSEDTFIGTCPWPCGFRGLADWTDKALAEYLQTHPGSIKKRRSKHMEEE